MTKVMTKILYASKIAKISTYGRVCVYFPSSWYSYPVVYNYLSYCCVYPFIFCVFFLSSMYHYNLYLLPSACTIYYNSITPQIIFCILFIQLFKNVKRKYSKFILVKENLPKRTFKRYNIAKKNLRVHLCENKPKSKLFLQDET